MPQVKRAAGKPALPFRVNPIKQGAASLRGGHNFGFYPIKLVPLHASFPMIMVGYQWLIAHHGIVGD